MSLLDTHKSPWKKDNLIHSLEKALINLKQADSAASPSTKLQLKLIKKNISDLKLDIQKTNLRKKYESVLVDFSRAINNL